MPRRRSAARQREATNSISFSSDPRGIIPSPSILFIHPSHTSLASTRVLRSSSRAHQVTMLIGGPRQGLGDPECLSRPHLLYERLVSGEGSTSSCWASRLANSSKVLAPTARSPTPSSDAISRCLLPRPAAPAGCCDAPDRWLPRAGQRPRRARRASACSPPHPCAWRVHARATARTRGEPW
jgi:hypothetical protein